MVKTRSQTGIITIKKEEMEDCKPALALSSASNTRNKITTRKPSKNRNLTAPDIKVEEDTDTKSLLQSASNHSKLSKGQYISQEQISQLISVIVNGKIGVLTAARIVKVSYSTAVYYHNVYKNDPERKIPEPRKRRMRPRRFPTQEHTNNLIGYINNSKMPLKEASAKAGMSYRSGRYYYNRYLKDPNHNIPIPRLNENYTQDQKDDFIGYIVNDKMSITAASKKAKMGVNAGKAYYHKYFDDQNPDIATSSHITIPKQYTQEQIKELISYIVDDKMTIAAASIKANIHRDTASKHYRRYLKDTNVDISLSKRRKRYTMK